MTFPMVPISDAALVNPRFSTANANGFNTVAFLPMAGLSERGFVESAEERPLEEVCKGYTYFEEGDVLLAKITPCMENGKAAIVRNLPQRIGFGSTEFHVLRPKEDVDARYLFYMIWNPLFRHEASRNMTGSAGQKRVPADFVSHFIIPLPPLPEQRRIAAILDKADAIRRKRKAGIRLTEELLRSTFLEMFGDPATNPKGWPSTPFPDVCESRLGKMLDAKKQTGTMKKPYMRNFNVQWGRLDLSSVFEMDFAEEERAEFILKYGDVLICEGGAGVGQTAIWHDELPECYFQKSLHRVRPRPSKATSQYVSSLMWFLMQSGSILDAISSATIPHLTGEKLKMVRIPLPPYSEQVRYEKVAYSLASLELKRKAAASENSDLFDSLVQRAFRGEL